MKPVIAGKRQVDTSRPAELELVYIGGTAVLREAHSTAHLLSFGCGGVRPCGAAKPLLETKGVDTSFTEWDAGGDMKLTQR